MCIVSPENNIFIRGAYEGAYELLVTCSVGDQRREILISMASSSSRVLRHRSSRMTPYSVNAERKSRKTTPSEFSGDIVFNVMYNYYLSTAATSDSSVNNSMESTVSSLTTDQLAIISTGLLMNVILG